jgi:WD40 repeat protein
VGRNEDLAGTAVAVLPDGRILTSGDVGSGVGRVLVWDPTRPNSAPLKVGQDEDSVDALLRRGQDEERVTALAVLPDGRIVTGSDIGSGGRVRVWDPARPEDTSPLELGQDEDGVGAVAVLPDGRIVTGGSEVGVERVLVWDLTCPDAAPIELGRDEQGVGAVAGLPDGRVVTGGLSGFGGVDARVLVWDLTRPEGTTPIELGSDEQGVGAVAVLPDGRVVTGGSVDDGRGRVLVWDPTQPGARPTELGSAEGRVNAAAVLGDGRVATVGGGWLRIWDLAASAEVATVACAGADLAVAADDSGEVNVVVLHESGWAVSGWAVPRSPRPAGWRLTPAPR